MSDVSFRSLNLGNTADDDPQVLDSLVQQEANPPTPVVEPIVTPSLPEPRIPTRLLSVRQLVDPTWAAPTMVLPADTERKYLTVSVTSPAGTTTDGVAVVSEVKGSVATLGILTHGRTLALDGHTGPVWVLASSVSAAAAVYVDAWSVTK